MYQSKLISILRTLTNKELKRFESYIISPFFNNNVKVTELFHIVRKYHPEYPEEKVEMAAIFPKLFPGQKLEEQKLRYVMSDLTSLLEDCLSYLEFDKNDIFKKHLLLNSYDNRNLDKYFVSAIEDAREIQQENPYRD